MNKPVVLSKKHDWKRRGRSFVRHAFLLSKPLSIAAASTALWYKLHLRGIYFARVDESILMGAVLTMLSVIFSITAALVLNTIWEKFRIVGLAVLRRDRETFLLYRDERMPVVLHLLLFAFTLPIIGIIGLLDYRSIPTGMFAVFSVTFVFALYWLVVIVLEDPVKSPWLKERIPAEWLSADVDAEFKFANPCTLPEKINKS